MKKKTRLMAAVVLFAAPKEDYWKIRVEYAQAIVLAYGIKELCKACVSRARPYMYFDEAPESKIFEGDRDDFFISGHSTDELILATEEQSRNKSRIIRTFVFGITDFMSA